MLPPTGTIPADADATATGGWLTVKEMVVVAVEAWLSVTVSVAVKDPAVTN